MIAVGAVALFVVLAWAWFQLARAFALPSWIPYTFLAVTAGLLVALWWRARARKTSSGD
jgi:hypothetical protein